jgi:hypothetical protein
VAEPQGQATLQRGVYDAGKEAGVTPIEHPTSTRAALDDHLTQLQTNTDELYKKMDDAAGFDVKALKDRMGKDQYNLDQLGNTDEDIAESQTLQKSIGDAQNRITAAEQKMSDAGIDPKAADASFGKMKAAEEFRDKILHNQNIVRGNAAQGQEETVDVDSLTKESQKMLDQDKFGVSRLEQFMGKDGATEYMNQLRKYQEMGVKAVKAQTVVKIVGKALTAASLTGFSLREVLK